MAIQSFGAAWRKLPARDSRRDSMAADACTLFAPEVVRSVLDLGTELRRSKRFRLAGSCLPRRRQRKDVDELIYPRRAKQQQIQNTSQAAPAEASTKRMTLQRRS